LLVHVMEGHVIGEKNIAIQQGACFGKAHKDAHSHIAYV